MYDNFGLGMLKDGLRFRRHMAAAGPKREVASLRIAERAIWYV